MDFSARKLGRDAAADLETVPGNDLAAGRPVFYPLYLFLRQNQKFLQFRRPYDLITEQDLSRLEGGSRFYRPKLDNSYTAFHSSGKRLRVILGHRLLLETTFAVEGREAREELLTEARLPAIELPPAPFEISREVLGVIGPLWGRALEVSPVLVSVLVEALCAPISAEALIRARDADVDGYETAIRVSSWAVFVALHLGMCDLAYLDRMRRSVFEESAFGRSLLGAARTFEESELFDHVRDLVQRESGPAVALDRVIDGTGRMRQKLERRLRLVAEEHAPQSELAGGAWNG